MLTTEELQSAELHWIREVQHEAFGEVTTLLKERKPLHRSNKLLPCHPTLDGNGILQLGGRIDLASLLFLKIIWPGDHHLTRIFIKAELVRLLHAGPTLVSASLREMSALSRGRELYVRSQKAVWLAGKQCLNQSHKFLGFCHWTD